MSTERSKVATAKMVAEAKTKLAAARPPDFVATRNTLSKMLRSAGHAEAAKELAAQKRPTWPSWAIAEMATENPELAAALVTTGAALSRATSELRPSKPANVRAKQSEYSIALGAATRNVLDRLTRAGQRSAAAAHLREVRSQLRAMALAGASPLPTDSNELFATTELESAEKENAASNKKRRDQDQMHKRHLDHLHASVTKAERDLAKADQAQKKAESRLREADALRDRMQRALAAATDALAAASRPNR